MPNAHSFRWFRTHAHEFANNLRGNQRLLSTGFSSGAAAARPADDFQRRGFPLAWASVSTTIGGLFRPAVRQHRIRQRFRKLSNILISADNVTLIHGARPVLERVSLAVEGGEIVTIIGPNGAGKSTLVRLLLGLERPRSGTVSRRPGLRVGYLPQGLELDPVLPLSVRRLLTLTQSAGTGVMAAALARVGASGLLNASVRELSGGELQRVLLARALLRRPGLLVLDEPTAGIDYRGEAELYGVISDIRDEIGCGVLLVSHDLHVVMAASDRVVCLNRHVCCSGTPEAVQRHDEYIRLFGAGMAASLAVYRHDASHDHAHHGHGPGHDHDHDHEREHEHDGPGAASS